MAKCEICEREMLSAKGCLKGVILDAHGRTYKRIVYGDEKERWSDYGFNPSERCGDCGCELGQYHHPGCDIETCPICGGQLITCGCIKQDRLIWNIKEDFSVWF